MDKRKRVSQVLTYTGVIAMSASFMFTDREYYMTIAITSVAVLVLGLCLQLTSIIEFFRNKGEFTSFNEGREGQILWFLVLLISAGILYYSGQTGLAIVDVIFLVYAFLQIRYAEKQRETELEKRAIEAENLRLKSQLNPHFLFNSLNGISSLIDKEPLKAQEGIGVLSDMLRYALYETKQETVPISAELEFIDNYLSLMVLRYGYRLSLEYAHDDFDSHVMIAPMLFISIVENAFKHGVSRSDGSSVRINVVAQGSDLVFTCENSIASQAGRNYRAEGGIGLENLSRRLEIMYKGCYHLDIGECGNMYKVTLTIRGIC